MSEAVFEHIDQKLEDHGEELIALRRHLHQHPELSGEEFETTKLLTTRLREEGFEITVRPEGTGFFADLTPEGFDPSTHKTVAVRCDLDALPIFEENKVEYRSKRDGIMHACGHDAHMTIATGVGIAFPRKDELPGRLRLIYQHAEETSPGGASELIAMGVMKGVDHVLALHVDPELEVGRIGVRAGAFTAAFDTFAVKILGKSGHGARPHHSIDPIFVMTQLANALYNAVGRHADARDPMVLSIGIMEAGKAPNVIPDTAFMKGSIRTLSQTNRQLVEPLLRRICEGICETYGAEYELDLYRGSAAIINDRLVTNAIARAGEAILGDSGVHRIPLPSMGSEDFSDYLAHAPGAMFRLGVANDRPRYFLHSAHFDIDERAIQIGARVLARTALELMR